MRRLVLLVVVAGAWFATAPGAQELAEAPQTFRVGVDLIRLDVSVLDDERRPVPGLAADDFTVLENGRPQRIVAVTEVDALANDPAPSAWMRYASRDVISNDLADQLGDGRTVAIVMDERNVPQDETEIAVAARDLARYVINGLGPSDLAAVVFPSNGGKTQDFTADRWRLLDAVDRFRPEQPEYLTYQPTQPGAIQGDIRRYSPALGRNPCFELQPAIPTLRTITQRLSTVPNRRKTVVFVSVGVPVPFTIGRTRCQGVLYEEMRRVLREAQRWNVNVHAIDPAGNRGYEMLLQESRLINGHMTRAVDAFSARQVVQLRHEFLRTLADQTGGRAVIETDELAAGVDQIFAETAAYYLVGYEPSNTSQDGKFRRVEVQVDRQPEVTVRTRSGYWAEDEDGDGSDEDRDAPPASALNLSGLMSPQRLALRASLLPVARAASGSESDPEVEVAAVLTVRVPTARQTAEETLTLIRTVSTTDGPSSRPVREVSTLTLDPAAGDEQRYDVLSRFSLPPGRHEVRFNATSRIADASGTVYAEVEVPDLSRGAINLSPLVLGAVPAEPAGPLDGPLGTLLPVVPTTARDFVPGDRITAFLRIFQRASSPVSPVTVLVRILGADDAEVVNRTDTIPADAFDADHTADFQTELPLSSLTPGLHLLSVTARLESGRSLRRDLVFRVR